MFCNEGIRARSVTEISVRCGLGSSLAREEENCKRSALDFLCMIEKEISEGLDEVIR